MRQWRLIDDCPAVGAHNMAVDQAILEAVSARLSPPTLRLYAWNPPCLSLGYGQRVADVDFERVAALGWDVVRRPTGGRAILHTDELTYSLALPADDDLAAGTVIDSYRRISAALLSGFSRLDIPARSERREEHSIINGAVCIETPSDYEITVNGRKLVGSAQVRRRDAVLQHGSIPLTGDLGRICDVLVYPDESHREAAKTQVRARAITLSEAFNAEVSWDTIAAAIQRGFIDTYAVSFSHQPLSSSEQDRAAALNSEIYANASFTRRR